MTVIYSAFKETHNSDSQAVFAPAGSGAGLDIDPPARRIPRSGMLWPAVHQTAGPAAKISNPSESRTNATPVAAPASKATRILVARHCLQAGISTSVFQLWKKKDRKQKKGRFSKFLDEL